MKKLVLIAIVASFATSAFAQKGLVELQGCFDGGSCDTLDFTQSKNTNENDTPDSDDETMNLALNYNHLFTDNFGAGLSYRSYSETFDGDVQSVGDKYNTVGLNFFWNIDKGWMGKYAALRYNMTSVDETDTTGDDDYKRNDIVLEYGHRVAVGKVWGLAFAWNPSVSYTMGTIEYGDSDFDDDTMTSLTINPVNFAVAF